MGFGCRMGRGRLAWWLDDRVEQILFGFNQALSRVPGQFPEGFRGQQVHGADRFAGRLGVHLELLSGHIEQFLLGIDVSLGALPGQLRQFGLLSSVHLARYGINGKLIDFGKQMEVPERDLIEEYLAFVDDVLDELDSREEVEYIRQIMKTGTGADRQLQVFQKTGDMKAVVDYIIEETEVGIDEDQDEVDRLPTAKAV